MDSNSTPPGGGTDPAQKTETEQRFKKFKFLLAWRHSRMIFLTLAVIVSALGGTHLYKTLGLFMDEQQPKPRFFQIATGASAGTYFPIGNALATIISHPPGADPCVQGERCGVPGLIAIAKTSPGSIANIRSVSAQRYDSALAQADIAAFAARGEGVFKKEGAFPDLRAIAALYPEAVHIVTAKAANIKTLQDLKGKRIGLGEKDSGTYPDALLIMRAAKIPDWRIKAFLVSTSRAAALLEQGELDAFFYVAGAPAALISDLAQREVIELLSLSEKEISRQVEQNDFFVPHIIAENLYPGLGPVNTVSVKALWLVHKDANQKLVYDLTRALWNPANHFILDQAHAQGAAITLDQAQQGVSIDLHPGAIRYYQGLLYKTPKDQPTSHNR